MTKRSRRDKRLKTSAGVVRRRRLPLRGVLIVTLPFILVSTGVSTGVYSLTGDQMTGILAAVGVLLALHFFLYQRLVTWYFAWEERRAAARAAVATETPADSTRKNRVK